VRHLFRPMPGFFSSRSSRGREASRCAADVQSGIFTSSLCRDPWLPDPGRHLWVVRIVPAERTKQMMPVPSHLRGLVEPLESAIDEGALSATVRCPCGETRFELLYPGQTHEHAGEKIPCTAEIDGNFFFVLKSRCPGCGREHLLFDADLHGWNGFICHDPAKAALARPQLVAWLCQCGEARHTGVVHVQTQGRDEFISEAGGRFDANRWPDAFGWFSLDLTCARCGRESRGLVSYETM